MVVGSTLPWPAHHMVDPGRMSMGSIPGTPGPDASGTEGCDWSWWPRLAVVATISSCCCNCDVTRSRNCWLSRSSTSSESARPARSTCDASALCRSDGVVCVALLAARRPLCTRLVERRPAVPKLVSVVTDMIVDSSADMWHCTDVLTPWDDMWHCTEVFMMHFSLAMTGLGERGTRCATSAAAAPGAGAAQTWKLLSCDDRVSLVAVLIVDAFRSDTLWMVDQPCTDGVPLAGRLSGTGGMSEPSAELSSSARLLCREGSGEGWAALAAPGWARLCGTGLLVPRLRRGPPFGEGCVWRCCASSSENPRIFRYTSFSHAACAACPGRSSLAPSAVGAGLPPASAGVCDTRVLDAGAMGARLSGKASTPPASGPKGLGWGW
mmetsp:Transcript_57633/g.94622  ORF Transcript_57633/g.94622 Transcript_57633/m.94622 type:complete len:380 (-) Transcript_57633:2912-4051(-)